MACSLEGEFGFSCLFACFCLFVCGVTERWWDLVVASTCCFSLVVVVVVVVVGWLVWLVGAAVRWFVRMEVANHCRKKKNKKQKQKTQKEEESGKEGGVAKGACAPEFGVGFEQAGCCCILWCWISFPKKEGACEDVREIALSTNKQQQHKDKRWLTWMTTSQLGQRPCPQAWKGWCSQRTKTMCLMSL